LNKQKDSNETREDVNWPPTLEETARKYMSLQLGGYYQGPSDCQLPKTGRTLAVIVPFRSRHFHLKYLLHYLHGILQRQQMRYVIVVAEQNDNDVFNKAQLMNSAFKYVTENFPEIDCFAFQDVDTLSEDDRILYRCDANPNNVIHLAHRIDKFNYTFCCGMTVGGVLLMRRDQFVKINGFSNQYFGWGAEDDDANFRIKHIGKFSIVRPQQEYYRFKMIKHERDAQNTGNHKIRLELLRKWKDRVKNDGLNSLNTNVDQVIKFFTHTRLYIKISPVKS